MEYGLGDDEKPELPPEIWDQILSFLDIESSLRLQEVDKSFNESIRHRRQSQLQHLRQGTLKVLCDAADRIVQSTILTLHSHPESASSQGDPLNRLTVDIGRLLAYLAIVINRDCINQHCRSSRYKEKARKMTILTTLRILDNAIDLVIVLHGEELDVEDYRGSLRMSFGHHDLGLRDVRIVDVSKDAASPKPKKQKTRGYGKIADAREADGIRKSAVSTWPITYFGVSKLKNSKQKITAEKLKLHELIPISDVRNMPNIIFFWLDGTFNSDSPFTMLSQFAKLHGA